MVGRLGDLGIEGGQPLARQKLVQQQLVVAVVAAGVAAQGALAGALRELRQRVIGHEAVDPWRRMGVQQIDQGGAAVPGVGPPLVDGR